MPPAPTDGRRLPGDLRPSVAHQRTSPRPATRDLRAPDRFLATNGDFRGGPW